MQVAAVVLAGGGSRRMGRDKALLEWHGRPLLEHVLSRLETGFEKRVVVGGLPEWVTSRGVLWIPDEHPGAGVAAAIRTALRYLQQPCFVCACDMPFVHVEFGRWLLENAGGAVAHVPLWRGQAQPLHAAWFPEAVSFIEASLQEGEHAVWRLLQRLESAGTLRWAEEEVIRPFDADGQCFVNLNTPQEWRQWTTASERR
ncbi:MAG: molybdenum cofactor guanylyltransferase [Armatimonadota bacterium]|nr:MAG: molybdenum cofactor guanylyltransferase [Armatimonadota bacterium]